MSRYTEVATRCRAASYDDRLATGMLYREAAECIEMLEVRLGYRQYTLECNAEKALEWKRERDKFKAELAKAQRWETLLRAKCDSIWADWVARGKAIEDAPHMHGCPANYSDDCPAWMNPGECNCWKRDALEVKD